MAYVVDDPNVLFTIQADGAPTNTGDIYGKNTLLVQTAPNTSLKVSRVALDISELSTDAQQPNRVIDYLGGDQGDEKVRLSRFWCVSSITIQHAPQLASA